MLDPLQAAASLPPLVPSPARELTLVHGERQELVPELLVHESIWPTFREKSEEGGA